MLQFDPEKRITARKALEHPYFKELQIPENDSTREKLPKEEFEFENYPDLTRE